MSATPVIAVFDVGKTNKKLFLFDENYHIVFEKSARFNETVDEDGFPCENLEALKASLLDSFNEVLAMKEYDVKAVNFSAYGASFVFIDESGNPLTPLYNYLKPFPEKLKDKFYKGCGDKATFLCKTASPELGNLNSGLQVYRLKEEQPLVFGKLKYALHLPQYLSYLVTGKVFSDITGIGCHTALWDFEGGRYHQWVKDEQIEDKLAPLKNSGDVINIDKAGKNIVAGIGLHDSSAALVPYLANFSIPFLLLSTGTWCISLNPFNPNPLTREELEKDCLFFLDYNGNPVKASRLFSGQEHENGLKKIESYFENDALKYKSLKFDADLFSRLKMIYPDIFGNEFRKDFREFDLKCLNNSEEAYYLLIFTLVKKQVASTRIVLDGTPVKRIFVDGGFSKNNIFMNLLAHAFPGIEVFAASMAQATALGTALAIHSAWNDKPMPSNLIELNYFGVSQYMI